MANKTQFLSRATDAIVELSQLRDKCKALANVYIVREFFDGGADPITQADLDAAGINLTVEKFNTIIVPTLGDFNALWANVALPAKARGDDLDKGRKDI